MPDVPDQHADRREAAARLRRLKDEILAQWVARVRSEVPAAEGRSRAVILDHIPHLLDQLAGSLEFASAPETEPPAAAQDHADQRADLAGYSLDQVVYEYHLLRRVVMDVLEAEFLLPRPARVAIHDGIDAAIQLATDEYVRRQQEDLRLSEERFRLLVSGVREYAIFMLDPGGRVVTWNAGAERIKGYTAAEIVGQYFSAFYTPEDRAAGKPERGLATATGDGSFRDEGRRVRKDGSQFWADVTITALRDEAGALRGFAKVTRDMTERHRYEEELRRRAEELAVASRAREEFLAMLSHELRNPLAPVMNAVHVMRMIRLDNPILQQSLSMIERQMRQMGRLVDDLLDMARITRGRVQLRKEPAELSVLVERAVETVRPLARERRHQLAVGLPPDPVWLEADPVRIEQVFVNLLTNAVKYTDPGGQVWVTAARDGDRAVLRVKDTGVGIAPELLPRVFDLFTQAARPIDRSQGGLGIGLALSRTLMELHGGTVEAHSAGPGKGSEFVVRLPVGAAPGEQAPDGGAEGPQPQGRAMQVLVVDDNVDAADSLAMLLRLHGHEVYTAHNGQAALEQANARRPAVVFLDIGLPGMDGYEVARRLRAREGQPRCLLVAITGYGQDRDREKSRAAGFDYHLVKPADPAKVEELLRVLAEGPSS